MFIEVFIANLWNSMLHAVRRPLTGGLWLGNFVLEQRPTAKKYFLPQQKRPEHLVLLGKTGSGKSFLLRHICLQDIRAGRGFLYFDFHGDAIPFLLAAIAEEQRRGGMNLGDRLVVIEPASPEYSIGLNPLEILGTQNRFVRIAALSATLKERLGLEHFGPQTEEVTRNALYALSECGLTLLELSALLTNAPFRTQCLKKLSNPEVLDYFQARYEPMSEGMKAAVRNPVLNKFSEFNSDPHFRHIVGQSTSTLNALDALNSGKIVLVDVNKGLLGKHAATLSTLVLAEFKAALFRRKRRDLYTIYCDEIQNLLTSDSDIDVLLSEARKFGLSIVSANQYLDQFPKNMRSAVQAVGTHIAFQLSNDDSQQVAMMLDGGRAVAERLRNLPKRHFVIKTGSYPWSEAKVPDVKAPKASYSELLERSRRLHARRRSDIEAEIQARRPVKVATEGVLDAWE